MNTAEEHIPLIDRMPDVRGEITPDADIAKLTWFRTGGPADILFKPVDVDDLCAFLAALDMDIPVTLIGVGSNMLVRDAGVRGVVIRLPKSMSGIKIEGDLVIAGAGAPDVAVANKAAEAGLGGLEFLRGIPGTIGGAVVMNAGAYDHEVKDVLCRFKAVDRRGRLYSTKADKFEFTYRHTNIPVGWTIVEATFKGTPADRALIDERMQAINDAREATQPLRTRTGGSTFKNPEGHKAWQLVDDAGCRGLKVGGAQVSEKHCNFLINTGGATSADIENLGEEVRRRVKDRSGVDLEWEIRRIGVKEAGK